MTLRINTNISALNAQKNLDITDKALSKSIEKLTTGKELNTSGDDASAMAIADVLQSNVLGLEQAQKNITDAISMLQIADGALEESINIVNTIKQKAIQSAQDAQSLESRKALQADVVSLLEELDVIAKTTNFNGKKLLSGNFINKQFQIGSYAGETASISINSALPSDLGFTNTTDLTLSGDGGRVRLAIYSSIKGETFFLEEVDVGYYGHLDDGNEKSMQALADIINKSNDDYNVTATTEVISTSSSLLSAGTTEDSFKINGVAIGQIAVVDGDSEGTLVNAINTQTVNTHVKASLNSRGNLVLTSLDGRAIKVEADSITNKTNTGINAILGGKASEMTTLGKIVLQQRGAARVVMENVGSGNAVNVSGTGIEFGNFYVERDSTLKSGTVIDGGSILAEGFTIGQDIGAGTGTTGASTEDLTALFGGSAALTSLTTTSDSTFKSGSIIVANSQIVAGSTVGTNMTLSANVASITDGTIAVGSTIKVGSIIGAGTALGSTLTTSSTFTTLSGTLKGASSITGSATADASVIGSTGVLASGATLTIPASKWKVDGETAYQGSALTLTGDGTKTIGELLAAQNYTSGDIKLDTSTTVAINGQFKGSITNVVGGATLGVGSTLNQDVTTSSADVTVSQAMTLAGSSTLASGSVLSNGSTINQAFTLGATTSYSAGDGDTILKSGSTLVLSGASKITSGSTIGAKLTLNDTAGNYIRVTGDTGFAIKAGTTLKECTNGTSATVSAVIGNGSDVGGSLITAKDEVVGTNGMRISAGSTLYKGTVLKKGTHLLNDFTATDGTTYKAYSVLGDDITLASSHTLSSYQVIESGSTITANSTLKPQTQGLTYATTNLGTETVYRLSEVNILSAEGAQNAIVIASNALINLDEVRAEIGATYQRLTTTEVNIATTTINLSAAESAIRDVDFSAETANLSRLKILARTGTYALQQANASAEAVLELLQ